MNTQPLFLDQEVVLDGVEKYAGMLTRLGDNTDNWPLEVSQEAYKRLPYLSDFEINVTLDRINEERGYAFGSIEVRPKTAMNMEEQETSPLRKVHVPVIVREQMLCPFDVFMRGKRYEFLSEGRLRGALHRPEMFDAARVQPADPSLVNDLQPPIRSGNGMGVGGAKVASALLPKLHGMVARESIQLVRQELEKSASLRARVINGPAGVKAAFESALKMTPSDPMKVAQYIGQAIPPKVVQLRKQANGKYLVKWANPEMYAPQEEEVGPEEAANLTEGSDVAQQELEQQGVTTNEAADAPAAVPVVEEADVKVIDSFGLWKVQDVNGNTLVGWVFPVLLSADQQPMPMALFTNGSQCAIQEQIVGELAGKSVDLPKAEPRGYGCLYFIENGKAKAMAPMTISTVVTSKVGVTQYMAANDLGESFSFSFSPDVKSVVKVGPEELIYPDSYSWMPLRGKTELVQDPSLIVKVAGFSRRVEIRSDGSTYSFSGTALTKLASSAKSFLSRHDAEFLAASLGIRNGLRKEALNRAKLGREPVRFLVQQELTPAKEKWAAARAAARKMVEGVRLPRHFLVKEASFLDDAMAADKILGLGFLNAENVATFVDMLPSLEDTSSNLAELLIAVRVGLKNIPEVAVERMLAALEDVIRGLKSLQHEEITYQD